MVRPSIELGGPIDYDQITVGVEQARKVIVAAKLDLTQVPDDVVYQLEQETIAVMERCARQWLGLQEDAANGDKAAAKKIKANRTALGWWKSSWQSRHVDTLRERLPELVRKHANHVAQRAALPGPNGEKMIFRDDEGLPAPPHMKAPTGYTGNMILQAARKWTKRTPVTCDDVITILPTLNEADRTHADWIKQAGFLALQVAVQREVASWKIDYTAAVQELHGLAPSVPADVILGLCQQAYTLIGVVGLKWHLDAQRTPAAVADALRKGMPTLVALHADYEVEWFKEQVDATRNMGPGLEHTLTRVSPFDYFDAHNIVDEILDQLGKLGPISAQEAEAYVNSEVRRRIDKRVAQRAAECPEEPLVPEPFEWRLNATPPPFSAKPDGIWPQEPTIRANYHKRAPRAA